MCQAIGSTPPTSRHGITAFMAQEHCSRRADGFTLGTPLFCVSVFCALLPMQHGAHLEVWFATADADSKESTWRRCEIQSIFDFHNVACFQVKQVFSARQSV